MESNVFGSLSSRCTIPENHALIFFKVQKSQKFLHKLNRIDLINLYIRVAVQSKEFLVFSYLAN